MANAIEIIERWLKERGYDGLCYPEEECGCQIGDLIPCQSYCGHCQPGYLHKDGLMYTEPPEPTWGIRQINKGERSYAMTIESNHTMPRDYLFPGARVWCLICAGLSHPKIVEGTVEYLSYNECGEGLWYYYAGVPKRYSKYVCIDPLIQSPKSRGMSRNWIYPTKEEALQGAELLRR